MHLSSMSGAGQVHSSCLFIISLSLNAAAQLLPPAPHLTPKEDALFLPAYISYRLVVYQWFKPALPNPELCVVHSCSQDPEFYQDGEDLPCLFKRWTYPFGTLPGYKTSLGVVAVPTTPVGGYVYCPDAKKWVLYAELHFSPSAGRGTRRGGTPPARRRRG